VRAADLLAELFEPSLRRKKNGGAVVELYASRLLEKRPDLVYPYLFEERTALLSRLSTPQQKARLILRLWALAPAEQWGDWAFAMRGTKGLNLAYETTAVLGHMLSSAAMLEPSAIRSVPEHLEILSGSMAVIGEESQIAVVATAAENALEGRQWWVASEDIDTQGALHELIRAIEEKAPKTQSALCAVRTRDISRASLEDPVAVQRLLTLANDLRPETYDDLIEGLPSPEVSEQPDLYAETAVARAVLQVRDPLHGKGSAHVRPHLNRIKALVSLNGYVSQRRAVAVACLDLQPTPSQLRILSQRLGFDPGEEGLAALGRWRRASDRHRIADAIVKMIRPHFDARRWVAVLSEDPYTEAPVIRALREALLSDGSTVDERRRMAMMVETLRLRTQSGRDQIGDLIVDLLDSKPKSNLYVALALCKGLGPQHRREVKLTRAFERYARKRSHQFTPAELGSIAAIGIEIPEKYLSKGARKRSKDIIADGLKKAHDLAKFMGLGGEEN
jgi:hypothetical protein